MNPGDTEPPSPPDRPGQGAPEGDNGEPKPRTFWTASERLTERQIDADLRKDLAEENRKWWTETVRVVVAGAREIVPKVARWVAVTIIVLALVGLGALGVLWGAGVSASSFGVDFSVNKGQPTQTADPPPDKP